jgi:hypothetical protein
LKPPPPSRISAAACPSSSTDRADVAVLLGASLHLGQDDLPAVLARQMVYMIGLSTHNAAQMQAANDDQRLPRPRPHLSDRLQRTQYPVVGLAGLRGSAIAPLSKRPVVAIGGITFETAASVIEAGADAGARHRRPATGRHHPDSPRLDPASALARRLLHTVG